MCFGKISLDHGLQLGMGFHRLHFTDFSLTAGQKTVSESEVNKAMRNWERTILVLSSQNSCDP